MDVEKYEKLLDNCYSELPEVLYKKERFEIPEVSGRIVKTRTQISNFADIAKHFQREVQHMYRFFLKFLGMRGEYNENNGTATLFSRFQPAMLNKGVKAYYDQYVECEYCKSPDTELLDNNLLKKCKACGHEQKVSQI